LIPTGSRPFVKSIDRIFPLLAQSRSRQEANTPSDIYDNAISGMSRALTRTDRRIQQVPLESPAENANAPTGALTVTKTARS